MPIMLCMHGGNKGRVGTPRRCGTIHTVLACSRNQGRLRPVTSVCPGLSPTSARVERLPGPMAGVQTDLEPDWKYAYRPT